MQCSPSSSTVAVGCMTGHVYFVEMTDVEKPRLIYRSHLHHGPILQLRWVWCDCMIYNLSDNLMILESETLIFQTSPPSGLQQSWMILFTRSLCWFSPSKFHVHLLPPKPKFAWWYYTLWLISCSFSIFFSIPFFYISVVMTGVVRCMWQAPMMAMCLCVMQEWATISKFLDI